MTPGEMSAQGKALKITMPDGLRYIPAHVFDTSKGIVFATLDWDDPFAFGQPVHELIGECLQTSFGWSIESQRGVTSIQVLTDSSETMKVWMDSGQGGSREGCWQRIAHTLRLDEK